MKYIQFYCDIAHELKGRIIKIKSVRVGYMIKFIIHSRWVPKPFHYTQSCKNVLSSRKSYMQSIVSQVCGYSATKILNDKQNCQPARGTDCKIRLTPFVNKKAQDSTSQWNSMKFKGLSFTVHTNEQGVLPETRAIHNSVYNSVETSAI
jgi:hypothetical protein